MFPKIVTYFESSRTAGPVIIQGGKTGVDMNE